MADSVKIYITGDNSGFKDALEECTSAASKTGQSTESVFSGIMKSQIVTKAISMLKDAASAVLQTGMAFESAMSSVAAISGATGDDLDRLTETAKYYGETTKFSATEAANALYYMSLAGWDADQSIAGLPGVLNLAAASGMDLASASDMVTDYLTAFGMAAEDATYMSDVMAKAQATSNTTAAALGEAYGNCAASLHGAGQDIETTSAALMVLANAGIKGSEAGTQMAAITRDITQKMEDGKIMIGDTAVTVMDAEGNFRDLSDIMVDVEAATAGMGTAEASAALMETFTARSVKAVQTILGQGVDQMNEYEESLRNSQGTASDQASTMIDNLEGDVTIFKSALEGLEIEAYSVFDGLARDIVQSGTEILSGLTKGLKANGFAGMIESLVDQLPSILDKAMGYVTSFASSLSKALPGMVKGLVKKIPDLLSSALKDLPGLVGSLSSGLGEIVGELIVDLPGTIMESLPSIVEGVIGIGKSLVTGLFTGLYEGLNSNSFENVIADSLSTAIDNADTSSIDVGEISLTGTVDASELALSISNAIAEIRSAVEGTGLSNSDQEELVSLILSNSGYDALELAIEKMGKGSWTTNKVKENLSTAITDISAIYDELGLTDEQKTALNEWLQSGGDLQTGLEEIGGIDTETAKAAADKINSVTTSLKTSLKRLGLTDAQIESITAAASGTRDALVAALEMFGLSDEEIATVVADMDTLAGTISTKMSAIFAALTADYTDKDKGNNDAAADTAAEQSEAAFNELANEIDTWEQNALEQLELMGLSAEQLAAKQKEIHEEAAAMRTELEGLKADTAEWISDNADAAVETVQSHLDQLSIIEGKVIDLESRISALSSQLTPEAYAARTVAEAGITSDVNTNATAIEVTYQERELAYSQAQSDYAAASEAANALYAEARDKYAVGVAEGDADAIAAMEAATAEYESSMAVAEETYNAAISAADATYNDHMAKILKGMTTAADSGAVDKYKATTDAYIELINAIAIAAADNGETPELSDSTLAVLADLGSYNNVYEGVDFTNPRTWSMAAEGLKGYQTALQPGMQRSFDNTNMATVLSWAMSNGYLSGFEGGETSDDVAQWVSEERADVLSKLFTSETDRMFDADNPLNLGDVTVEADSVDTSAIGDDLHDAGSSDGANYAEGLAEGIDSNAAAAVAAAGRLAAAVYQRSRTVLGINSPSKKMREVGEYTGLGFSLGLDDSLKAAISSAQRVVGLSNLSPRADYSGISSDISSAAQSITDAETGRPIRLYIRDKELATTMAGSTARAGVAYSKTVNMGYGK